MFVVRKMIFACFVWAIFIFSGAANAAITKNTELNYTSLIVKGNDSELITRYAATGTLRLTVSELPKIDLRYHNLPARCAKPYLPMDCIEATACTQRSGIYKLGLFNLAPIYAQCDVDTEDGGWTVIQSRQDGTVDFYRNWVDYENGFGNLNGEFFIGLKTLHALTNYNGPQELLIIMESPDLVLQYARYDTFVIGNTNENYALKQLGQFSGTARDSLRVHAGMPFTTKDRNNGHNRPANCAEIFTGAWWYINCMNSNLNGVYGKISGNGIYWHGTAENSNQKYVKMMIRRRRY